MSTGKPLSADEAIDILRLAARMRGGWLTSMDYQRLPPPKPALMTLYKALGVNGWGPLCAKAGIAASHEETLPAQMSEADIKFVLKMNRTYMRFYSVEHRQQIGMYCLKHVTERLGVTRIAYKAYDNHVTGTDFVRSESIVEAFDGWNEAIMAAGLQITHEVGDYQKRTSLSEAEQDGIISDTQAQAYPANWRTSIEVGLQVLEPVTTVTQVYRHNRVPEYGLRHTEQRMQIR